MDADFDALAMGRESDHCLRRMRRVALRYPRWWAVGASYEELAKRLVDALAKGSLSDLRIRRTKAILCSYANSIERLNEALILIGFMDSHYESIQSRLNQKFAEVSSIEARMAMNEALSRECA